MSKHIFNLSDYLHISADTLTGRKPRKDVFRDMGGRSLYQYYKYRFDRTINNDEKVYQGYLGITPYTLITIAKYGYPMRLGDLIGVADFYDISLDDIRNNSRKKTIDVGSDKFMCELCLQSPCVDGCPNAEPPKAVYVCQYCEKTIDEGDKYFDYMNAKIHMSCLESMSPDEIVETFIGTPVQIARAE